MAEPIVFISCSRIVDGKRAEFARAFAGAVEQIRQSKPRTALFAAYVDEAGTAVKIIHVFPDAAAMADHFRGADERTQSVSELIVPIDFEVYGPAPAAAIDQLRREAAAKGGAVEVLADPIGGFLRAG
jgi:quinol monooxygenase YgiN